MIMGFIKKYIVAVLLNVAVLMVVLCTRGFGLKIYYVDAFSVAGAVSVLIGLLLWVAAAGAFDTIGYGFSTFGTARKYKDLYDYTVQKREKRSRQNKAQVPFIVVGIVFLAVSALISVF